MTTIPATASASLPTGSGSIAPHRKSLGLEFIDYSVPGDLVEMNPVPTPSTSMSGSGGDLDVKEENIKGKNREISVERDEGSDSDDQKWVQHAVHVTDEQKAETETGIN